MMGKVLSNFNNGWAGTPSRSHHNVIASFRNAGGEAIPYGCPVFIWAVGKGVMPYDDGSVTAENFAGFTVRVPDDAPDGYRDSESAYQENDPVDVLTWGTVVVKLDGANIRIGDPVYLNPQTRKLVTVSGQGCIQLPGVVVRGPADSSGFAEVTVTQRRM